MRIFEDSTGDASVQLVGDLDRQVCHLWWEADEARRIADNIQAEHHKRTLLLPWWALPGYEFVQSDGTFSGSVTMSPASPEFKLPNFAGGYMRIRTSSYQIEKDAEARKGLGSDAALEQAVKVQSGKLNERLSAQKREFERVGLPDLKRRYETAKDYYHEACWTIRRINIDHSKAALAAMVLLDIVSVLKPEKPSYFFSDLPMFEVARRALRNAQPCITGLLAQDVAEILDHPKRTLFNIRPASPRYLWREHFKNPVTSIPGGAS